MTRIAYYPPSQAYFATDITMADYGPLTQLLWKPHPDVAGVYFTRSPYLAAPLFDNIAPDDAVTRNMLWPFAWNYQTSFAKNPIPNTGIDSIRIPKGERPYPFQVAGVQRGMMRQRILIGDAPGLGKSNQSLVLANMRKPKRTVIGCPTFLTEHWANECDKWLVDPQSISILDSAKKNVPETGVLIVPYSRGHSFSERILKGPPINYLIMDELHQLKSPTAQRTAPWLGASGLTVNAQAVTALTGTPILNNPLEIHGALQVLTPETMATMSRESFKQEYCSTFTGTAKVPKKGGGEASVQFEKNEGRNEWALNAELRASGVMIRRSKEDVLTQLPPKNVFLVHLTPNAQIEELVREEANLYTMLETKLLTGRELIELQGHISEVRRRLGTLKAPKIAEYVRSLFEQGEVHIVLFMLHLEAIEIIRKTFVEHTRIKVRVLTGSQSVTHRQNDVKEFQTTDDAQLIIGQINAAGLGLTMTRARYCVLGEITWTPGINDQALDRCHRISQTKQVNAPIITFPHACEERVIKTNAKKAISALNILDVNLQKMFPAHAA